MKVEPLRTDKASAEPFNPVAIVQGLDDAELASLVAAGQVEIQAREKRRKEEAIAKIRELAGAAGLSVAIEGARGRPGGRSAVRKKSPADTEAG